jgi:4'-phosphopantetheinyl transferase
MGLAGSLQYGEAHVWQVQLDNPIWDTFSSVLSADELERAKRYRTAQLQQSFSRCRSALRLVLARYVNRPASELSFNYGQFGKPELAEQRLQFNLSHSGGHALIAISSHTVGIDLEFMGKENLDLPGMIGMVCHAEEKAALSGLEGAALQTAFYRLWSRKEAYCKMRGVGIGIALPSLHFRPAGAEGVFEVCQADPAEPASFVTDLPLLDTHSASICLPLPNARIEVFQA